MWKIPLDKPDDEIAALTGLLSPDEVSRMERLRFEIDQRRFIVARGSLRLILSRYVGAHASSLTFLYGPYGKPALLGADLAFNLAHSEALALCAVARSGPVGIDIEKRRPLPDAETIADQFFCAAEVAVIRRLPPGQHEEAFLRCWTRKEAYVKALGQGLVTPLASFAVTLAPDEPARLCWVSREPNPAMNWTVSHLEPGDEYMGALVVAGRPRRIQRWLWTQETPALVSSR